jgi:hypothetical protein
MMIGFYWWPLIHPIGAVQRWLFGRCAGCGGLFPFFYWPSCDYFEDQIPPHRWYESEQRIYHSECYMRSRELARG